MRFAAALAASGLMIGCAGPGGSPDLGAIYNTAAQRIGDERTPVVVVPGILGSKLVDVEGQKVWGSFTFGAADADTPGGARKIALPMGEGAPLADLRDRVFATDVLDVVVADVGLLRGLEFSAYIDILATLAVGEYADRSLGESGAIDYGDAAHYTCFQQAYDWRRDVSEAAAYLHETILDAQRAKRLELGLPADAPLKVDVVAHSMGGLVLRYYLRYGPTALPDDGSIPPLTWAGARHVSRAILVGTPNAGSVLALEQLVHGWDLRPLFPYYRPAVLGTMPAIYQLLPRRRHARVIDEAGGPIDLFDPAVWRRYGWGLADPTQDRVLAWLLPDVETAEARRRIADDHLAKCLARAEQLHLALDAPAAPPPGLELHLFAGDAERTPDVIEVARDGSFRVVADAPGDNTVTRSSALMDERVGRAWAPGLRSPIAWTRVQFLFEDHLGLTNSAAFTDNLLYLLLEAPRGEEEAS